MPNGRRRSKRCLKVRILRALEIAANGKSARTDKAIDGVGDHASDLISDALSEMERNVDGIDRQANTLLSFDQATVDPQTKLVTHTIRWRKAGMLTPQANQLKGILETCQKIGPATQEIADALGDKTTFPGLAKKANRLATRAHDILGEDYSGIYDANGNP